MNILIVKLSSLGDVLHNLPVVWDIRERYPDARVDWVVEEGFVHLLEPLLSREGWRGLDNIIPTAFRRWKKAPLDAGNRAEFGRFRQGLRAVAYDRVIETQGLLKSALVTRLARKSPGAVVAGLANRTEHSGYEPLARLFYTHSVSVPVRCHAVERSRLVAGAAMGMSADEATRLPPRFYPADMLIPPVAGFEPPYVLCFQATARAAKRWEDANWVALGKALSKNGVRLLFPWGSPAEKVVSERLAAAIPGAAVPRAFSLMEAFAIVAGARLTIGVDTGLTHLSAVLNRPTVELYCDSPRWKTEGYWSPSIRNLGDIGEPPPAKVVTAAVEDILAVGA